MMGKGLHLRLSGIIVILAGIGYGGAPAQVLPLVLGVEVTALEVKHILRAVMGIYAGIGVFWLLGAHRATLWYAATLSNVLFMGGISLGRLIASLVDGALWPFTVALVLELWFFAWGLYNLKKYGEHPPD
ncbi:DUF4345 domain-containing protein [Maribacter sp. 2307ULW6-5]|uniref:DUF4345 domain-containing protein n=1 Tax=Maribacter sp. 2307ULW6-5 TaxID=3386275 RepID=UPI0039BCA131